MELNWKNHLWIDFLLGAAFLAAFYVVTSHISSSVRRSAQFRFVPDTVDTFSEGLPEPLSFRAQEEIKNTILRVRAFNPLLPDQVNRVRSVLLCSPWVKSVREAQISVTGLISFSAEVRKPVAWVLQKDYWHLCDSEGVRLPLSMPSSSEPSSSLPAICGLSRTERLPRIGERWGSNVLEAVSVAELLAISQETGAIPALGWQIDTSSLRAPEAKVVIASKDGRRFEWGRSPLSPKPDLLSSKEKLDNLAFLLKSEDVVGKRSYYLLWTVPTAGPRFKEDLPVTGATQSQQKVAGNSSRWRQF
jgi:hypothetical protein